MVYLASNAREADIGIPSQRVIDIVKRVIETVRSSLEEDPSSLPPLPEARWVRMDLALASTKHRCDEEEPPLSLSIAGGVGSFSGTLGAGDGLSDLGSEGTGGGVAPSALISMRGFVGVRVREAFDEAALPGRGGRMNVARGASSESSEDELESSESLSLTRDLLRG